MRPQSPSVLYGLFFLSGATALVYQVVWTRILTLFFGSTTLAVSTVLAVFMAGLAIGSALFGNEADRLSEPVRFYGWLELVIGILAITTPLIFSVIEKIYVSIIQYAGPDLWSASMIRFFLSSLLLLPPTILMGGTLPVLSKVFLDEQGGNTGRSISLLYFVNTAGAVAGTLASGMFLLQSLGIQRLLICGGLVNVGICCFAYSMPLLQRAATTQQPSVASASQIVPAGWSRDAVLAVMALFFSGMAALIYEVVWTRVLTLVIGSSTYAFTVMLATFLTGIAIGSALIARYSATRKPTTELLAGCQILIGVFALATAATFGILPDAFVALFGAVGQQFGLFLAGNLVLCFVVMVPATIFMGASFPVASAVVVASFGTSGRRIGLLYAGNTIGAILGAFLAGFVFLPKIGIQNTLIVAICINLGCALFLSLSSTPQASGTRRRLTPAIAVSLLVLLAFVWRPPWDKLKMTSGPYVYAVQYQKIPIEERIFGLELLFYREGPIATVSVVKEGKHVRLVVDGKTDAGNYRDMSTQVLAGHLPLLVKPDAKSVMIIGYASGITAGAAARHDVESVDCVEIEPAMKDASRFFDEENYRVIDDSRFHLIMDDARSHSLTSSKLYDVIISEPSNPWQAGSSRLFTKEAFRNARNRLKPGGIMAQWMHLYGVDVETFRLVVRTFLSVFPHVTLWMDPDFADVIFLGSSEPISIDPLTIQHTFETNARISASLSRIGYPETWSLFKAFLLNEADTRRFAGTGELNTDDLPHLEYRAPKSLYLSTALQENVRALLEGKSPESFPDIAVRKGEEGETASVLKTWGVSLAERKFTANARGALASAARQAPADDQTQFYLALLRMEAGDSPEAIASFERAVDLNPGLGASTTSVKA